MSNVKKSFSGKAHYTSIRVRLVVRGRVQGVGFRPFVYRLAQRFSLAGFVGNNADGAFIEIQGRPEYLHDFITCLETQAPPLAHIHAIQRTDMPPLDADETFRIVPSDHQGSATAEVTPDSATCADCLAELFDPADRRFHYPFINCTNCGPRYSIVTAVPYDRPYTTMHHFTMCQACRAEYENPTDRRFHAQPNACPACGPQVWLADVNGERQAEHAAAISRAATLLQEGKILAIRGLGGFHLACRADSDTAVTTLRERKHRESKPLAIMAADAGQAGRLVELSDAAYEALSSIQRPIVLCPQRTDANVSNKVAPGCDCLGVMLPYTPLHNILFSYNLPPLVMTSGNPSAEPLCADNDEALRRLGQIADAFVMHDRPIARRVDDSVVMAVRLGGSSGGDAILPLRRARGYVPAPIRVPVDADEPILAVGGQMKNTVCILRGNEAVVSEHVGDLDNPAAYRHFVGTIEQLTRLLEVEPTVVACDMHQGYASTQYAYSLGLSVVTVQHHHAHMAACMAENDIDEPVVAVACDGTGYGTDGAVWGCELLAGDARGFERAGRLEYFSLVGGDAAAEQTWRPAAGIMQACFGEQWPTEVEARFASVDATILQTTRLLMSQGQGMPTSSMGRLFDAVAWLLGVCGENRHDAEAPMRLEALAGQLSERTRPLDWECVRGEDGVYVLRLQPLLASLCRRIAEGEDTAGIAAGFHEAIAQMLADTAARIACERGIHTVVLTGGSFANRRLLGRMWELLGNDGLSVATHRLVPAGDGGVSLGQAIVAARQRRGG